MKPIISIFAVFLMVAPGQAQVRETPHYLIEADFRGEILHVEARVTIPTRFLDIEGRAHLDLLAAGSLRGVPRLQNLTVSHDGRPLEVEADSSGILVVPLVPGADPLVELRYQLAASSSNLEQIGYYLFSGHDVGSYWFPGVVGADGSHARFMDFGVNLTLSDTLTVLTTGGGRPASSVPGERQRRDGAVHEVRHRFVAEHETGFAVAIGGAHRLVSRRSEELEVLALVPEEDPDPFTEVAQTALDAAQFYREMYGFFPKTTLGLLPGPENFAGGFPMPGIFMVHRGNLTAEFVEFITAHELGHYYWGLHVLGDREQLDWLVLGMGIWADQRYLASKNGRTLDEQWHSRGQGDWMEDYLTAQAGNLDQRLGLNPTEEEVLEFDYNSLIRHGKGATGVFLQARQLGQESFLQLQREVLRDFHNVPFPVDSLVARLESKGLADAGAFFDRWVRGDAVIDYVVESVRQITPESDSTYSRVNPATDIPEPTNSPSQYEIVVRRTGTVPYPVEVEIEDGTGRRERFTVRSTVRQDTLRFRGDERVWVRIDPDGAVPMWSSTTTAIQRLRLHAFERAGRDEAFIQAARAFLATNRDDWALREAIIKLGRLGRFAEALSLAGGHLDTPCTTRDACLAALALASAASAQSEPAIAEQLLETHGAAAADLGLAPEVERIRREGTSPQGKT